MPVIAGRDVPSNDLGVLVGGAVVLVFSFFHWFSAPLDPAGWSGWDSGLFSFLGVLLAIAAAVVVGLRLFTQVALPRLQWGWSFLVLAAAGGAGVLILLKFLIGFGQTHRAGGLFLSLLGAVAEAVFAYRAFIASGETLPGGHRL